MVVHSPLFFGKKDFRGRALTVTLPKDVRSLLNLESSFFKTSAYLADVAKDVAVVLTSVDKTVLMGVFVVLVSLLVVWLFFSTL